MKTKKVKETITLHLETIEQYTDNDMPKITYSVYGKLNSMPPREIDVVIKREPNGLKEFIDVNNLNELEVMEFLKSKYNKSKKKKDNNCCSQITTGICIH